MKLAIVLAAVAGIALAIPTAQADETHVGVGVGPERPHFHGGCHEYSPR